MWPDRPFQTNAVDWDTDSSTSLRVRALYSNTVVITSLAFASATFPNATNLQAGDLPRVPAEWEEHQATWLQWPRHWEAELRPAFARIILVVAKYEPVHLIANSEREKRQASRFLSSQGVDIEGAEGIE